MLRSPEHMPVKKNLPTDHGDPTKTPFVRFDLGTLYPPNSIYTCAVVALEQLTSKSSSEAFKDLILRGPIGGSYGVLPDSTWFAVLYNFFRYHQQRNTGFSNAEECCKEALRLMIRRPHDAAWPLLRDFIITNANDLSGWNGSFQKSLAERREVFRGEDGNYYYTSGTDELIQIIGAKTAAETRLDYITNQLTFSSGFLHQILSLFSLFAIADDFDHHPDQYHRWIKASLPNPDHLWISANWQFLHFDYSRTYRWRPYSNLCDPQWLAGDILGKLTDTLEVDHWLKHRDQTAADEDWLHDGCKFQMDYVIETTISIGREDSVYIPFEGKVIRWTNGTPERDAIASISVADLQNHAAEDDKLNRLLTLLVWDNHQPIRKAWGSGGGRSPYPKVYSPRKATGLLIDLAFLFPQLNKTRSDIQWLALALYREAQNSSSTFYEYFCYWKIFDRVFPNPPEKRTWLNRVAVPKLGYLDHLKEIIAKYTDIEEYLRNIRLNAIKHVRRGTLSPDNPADLLAITKDAFVMENIAKLVMEEELKL
jgi:hypothetical protein